MASCWVYCGASLELQFPVLSCTTILLIKSVVVCGGTSLKSVCSSWQYPNISNPTHSRAMQWQKICSAALSSTLQNRQSAIQFKLTINSRHINFILSSTTNLSRIILISWNYYMFRQHREQFEKYLFYLVYFLYKK